MSKLVEFKAKAPRVYILELWEDSPRKIATIRLEGRNLDDASREADMIIASQYPEQDIYIVSPVN